MFMDATKKITALFDCDGVCNGGNGVDYGNAAHRRIQLWCTED